VRLFVEAAWRRHAELHAHPTATMRAAGAPKPRRRRDRWGMVLALAAIAAPFAWISLNPAGRAPRGTSARGPAPSAGAAHEDTELESLLTRADQALSGGSLTTPAGASAADLYREALRRNARDPRALEGLQQVIGRLLGSAEVQLQQGNLDAAQVLATQARAIEPQHPRVAFLLGQIGTAREHAVLEKAQRAAVRGNTAGALAVLDSATQGAEHPLVGEAREALAQQQLDARVTDYLDRARAALSRAQLIAPSEDNALFYIESARTLAPDDARVVEAAHDLGVRLESEARQALEARNPDAAESWISAAADAGADAEQVAALRAQIEPLRVAVSAEARTAYGQRSLEQTRGALAKGDLAAARHWLAEASGAGADAAALEAARTGLNTAEKAAESAAQLADTWVNENTLTRTHYVAPKYPEGARRRAIEGWVELHFVVGADGAVQGLTVAGAQPAGMFEQSALDAVAQWRYQPVQRDGQPTSQRAQVRLRFKVQR
jgi:TonB family protein